MNPNPREILKLVASVIALIMVMVTFVVALVHITAGHDHPFTCGKSGIYQVVPPDQAGDNPTMVVCRNGLSHEGSDGP